MVKHRHWEKRAAFILPRVIHHCYIVLRQNLREPTLFITLREIASQERRTGEIIVKLRGNLSQKNLERFISEDVCGEAKIKHVSSVGELDEAIRGTTVEESTEDGHGKEA